MTRNYGYFGFTLRIGAAYDELIDHCAPEMTVDRAELRKKRKFKELRKAENRVKYYYGANESVLKEAA